MKNKILDHLITLMFIVVGWYLGVGIYFTTEELIKIFFIMR